MELPVTSPVGVEHPATPGGRTPALALLYLAVTLYAGYFVLRFGGMWVENDTALFSYKTMEMLRAGTCLFHGQYPHGFGYQNWLASLALLTGISVPLLNTMVMPVIGALLFVACALPAYCALLQSDRASVIGVTLLFASPDLMFSLLRGNHEKLNIAFTLAAVYALFKGFEAMGTGWGHLGRWVLVFYLLVFANATTNDYFASTFAIAATLTWLFGYALLRFRGDDITVRSGMRRFSLTVAVSWLIVWWVMLFLFPQAGRDFALVRSAIVQLGALFASFHPQSDPYAASGEQWANPVVSMALALFRYILTAGSAMAWMVMLVHLVRGSALSLRHIFLVALYGAFGLLVVAAIPLDFAGLAAGSNLELRNFTYFTLFAAPILASGLVRILAAGGGRAPVRNHARWASALMMAVFVGIGLLKVTLDPAVSHQWLRYSASERQGLGRVVCCTAQRGSTWTGPDDRLTAAAANWFLNDPWRARWDRHPMKDAGEGFAYFLRTPQLVATTRSQHAELPPYAAMDRLYDNGSVQIYAPGATSGAGQ